MFIAVLDCGLGLVSQKSAFQWALASAHPLKWAMDTERVLGKR